MNGGQVSHIGPGHGTYTFSLVRASDVDLRLLLLHINKQQSVLVSRVTTKRRKKVLCNAIIYLSLFQIASESFILF